MVVSDGMVHFLKIEKSFKKSTKLSCGFNGISAIYGNYHSNTAP